MNLVLFGLHIILHGMNIYRNFKILKNDTDIVTSQKIIRKIRNYLFGSNHKEERYVKEMIRLNDHVDDIVSGWNVRNLHIIFFLPSFLSNFVVPPKKVQIISERTTSNNDTRKNPQIKLPGLCLGTNETTKWW